MKTRWLIAGALIACSVAVVTGALLLAGPNLGLPWGKPSSGALDTFQYLADGDSKPHLTAPNGATVTFVPVSRGDNPMARLTGVPPDAPPNGLPGIYLPLPDSFEKEASGQTVRITVNARRSPEAPSAAFAVAYSTNEVGNSGWHRFDLTDQITSYSFTYDVARMAAGQGDYIGILPDLAGTGGAVDISEITAEVFERGKLDAPANGTATSSTSP